MSLLTTAPRVPAKDCSVCGMNRPLEWFHRHPTAPDGRRAQCKDCVSVYTKKRYAENPQRHRDAVDRSRYGMEPGDYERMFAEQKGQCAICGRHDSECPRHNPRARGLNVDHDHTTGEVRGLLCLQCNLAVGYIEKAGTTAVAVAAYLEGRR